MTHTNTHEPTPYLTPLQAANALVFPDDAEDSAPVISEKTHYEMVVAKCQTEKAELKTKIRDTLKSADKINNELVRINGSISAAEQKLTLSSAPRGQYIDTRAEMLARGLMGEMVSVDTVRNADDFAQNLTAGDLQAGLRALRSRRDELVRQMSAHRAEARELTSRYYTAHAAMHAAKYMCLRDELIDAYVEVYAAQSANLSLTNLSLLTDNHFNELMLPALDNADGINKLVRQNPRVGHNTIDAKLHILGSIRSHHASSRLQAELKE